MHLSKKLSIVIATSMALVSASHAAIVGGAVTGGQAETQGGTFVQLNDPFTESNPDNTVGQNTFQDPNLYAFDEGLITVSTDLANEVTGLMAGMVVESHYIAFDPLGSTTLEGYVDFDGAILGIATTLAAMVAADTLVSTGVTYLNPGLVGLESVDSATISNVTRVLLSYRASSPGDFIRVFTVAQGPEVPLPAAAWMFLAGLGGLGAKLRKKVY